MQAACSATTLFICVDTQAVATWIEKLESSPTWKLIGRGRNRSSGVLYGRDCCVEVGGKEQHQGPCTTRFGSGIEAAYFSFSIGGLDATVRRTVVVELPPEGLLVKGSSRG